MKISGSQLFWIMFCFQVYYAVNPAFIKARQDAWIVIILAGIVTLAITFMMSKVSLLFPGKTIIESSREILGKWFGKYIMVPYFLSWFIMTVEGLREWADFVYMVLLPNTPVLMVVVLMGLLMTYVTLKGGITAIGRCSEVIGPLFLLVNFIPLFLAIRAMEWRNLQPIYADSGWRHIVEGTIPVSSILAKAVMLPLMLTAFMAEPKQAPTRALWSMGITSLLCLMETVSYLLLFGPYLASSIPLPWFAFIRSISILDFIQNIDSIAVFIWAFSHFISLSTSLFITSYGIAQWSNVKDWRKVTWVVVILVCGCVILTSNIGQFTTIVRRSIWIPWVFPVNLIGIPLLLWIVGSWKNRSVT